MVTDEIAGDGVGPEFLADAASQAVDVGSDVLRIPSFEAATSRPPAPDHPFHDAPRGWPVLPSPDELAAYERMRPGMADWRIRMAEKAAVHQQWVEKMRAVGNLLRSVGPIPVGGIGFVLGHLLL